MIVRKLLIAVAMVLALQPVSAAETQVPVDLIARAKFPKEQAAFIDALAAINDYINTTIQPLSDSEHYGVQELWVMMPADNKGDCEDYALSKLFILQQAQFPIVTNSKVVSVIVHFPNGDAEGHAILALLLPKGEVAYMDNRFSHLMTREELVARGYEFFDWRA